MNCLLAKDTFKNSIQGFVDENGVFYTRKEAGKHAYYCGQIDKLVTCLTSEDLY